MPVEQLPKVVDAMGHRVSENDWGRVVQAMVSSPMAHTRPRSLSSTRPFRDTIYQLPRATSDRPRLGFTMLFLLLASAFAAVPMTHRGTTYPRPEISGTAEILDGEDGFFRIHFARDGADAVSGRDDDCLLYTSPSPRDQRGSRMPSSA